MDVIMNNGIVGYIVLVMMNMLSGMRGESG